MAALKNISLVITTVTIFGATCWKNFVLLFIPSSGPTVAMCAFELRAPARAHSDDPRVVFERGAVSQIETRQNSKYSQFFLRGQPRATNKSVLPFKNGIVCAGDQRAPPLKLICYKICFRILSIRYEIIFFTFWFVI